METIIILIVITWFILGAVGSVKNVMQKVEGNKQDPRSNSENTRKNYTYREETIRSSTKNNQYKQTYDTKTTFNNYKSNNEPILEDVTVYESNGDENDLDIEMNMDTLKDGVLLSQILEQPRSKNPHRLYGYRKIT